MVYKIQFANEKESKRQGYDCLVSVSFTSYSNSKTWSMVLKSFYEGLLTQEYPQYLTDCINRRGQYKNGLSFVKGVDLVDGELIPGDIVVVKTDMGKAMLFDKQFYRISYDFGKASLNAVIQFSLCEKQLINGKWIDQVIDALVEIRIRL